MCASDFDEMCQFANVPVCQRNNRQFAMNILAPWQIDNWQIDNWHLGKLTH